MTERRGAFDPSRLDDELDDLLPPSPSLLAPAPIVGRASEELGATQAQTESPSDGPRTIHDSLRTQTVPARIPRSLYDELSRALAGLFERPSYAQIIAWTCAQQPQTVADKLEQLVAQDARTLRGRRSARDQTTIAPRFLADELTALAEVIKKVKERFGDERRVTRTSAICAAIQVALQTGLPTADDIAAGP